MELRGQRCWNVVGNETRAGMMRTGPLTALCVHESEWFNGLELSRGKRDSV